MSIHTHTHTHYIYCILYIHCKSVKAFDFATLMHLFYVYSWMLIPLGCHECKVNRYYIYHIHTFYSNLLVLFSYAHIDTWQESYLCFLDFPNGILTKLFFLSPYSALLSSLSHTEYFIHSWIILSTLVTQFDIPCCRIRSCVYKSLWIEWWFFFFFS